VLSTDWSTTLIFSVKLLVGTVTLKLKLKTNLYSAIKSEDLEALDSGTSQLGSQGGLMKPKCFEAVSKDS